MAENDVNRLIDMLYERVEDAKSPALKPNLSMVDRDEVLDLLDELRNQLPVELKRAQELLAAREKFVDEAKRDVERMMRQADLEAKSKVSDSEVLYAAKEKARKIIADAEDRSRQLCQVANEYAEDAMDRGEAVPVRIPGRFRRQASGTAGKAGGRKKDCGRGRELTCCPPQCKRTKHIGTSIVGVEKMVDHNGDCLS